MAGLARAGVRVGLIEIDPGPRRRLDRERREHRAGYITGSTLSVDGGTAASAGWIRSGAGWTLQGELKPSRVALGAATDGGPAAG